jgi:methyl-accepting chemotaxis protein
MSYLSKKSLRFKLFLLSGIPCLALLIFAIYFLVGEYRVTKEMKQAEFKVTLVLLLDDLITHVQEFSGKLVYSLSNTADKQSEPLSEAKNNITLSIEAFKELIDREQSSFEEIKGKKQINNLLERIKELLNQENLSAEKSLSIQATIEGFDQIQRQSISIMDSLTDQAAKGEITREILAYMPLFEEKVINGFMQQLMYEGLNQGKFTPEQFKQFILWINSHEIEKQMYLLAAPRHDEYDYYLRRPAYQEASEMIKQVVDKGAAGPYEIDPESWWQAQNKKITLLNDMEGKIHSKIDGMINSQVSYAQTHFYGTLIAIIVFFFLIFFLAKAIFHNILKPLQAAGQLANQVGAQASQILSSVAEVSAATMETAAAVTETTTTSEELKQTAQVAVEKAKDVSDSSTDAFRVLKSSEASLESTIDGMNKIQDGMKIISESILKLSEQCKAIGEIIDTVNDLSQQSNLLAVNAAIEAAKAGEQGKGFSVVAQEVRSLAEQSKQATIQVRSLLNDIQNATNSVVMASEQGTKAVVNGMTRTSETNQSIHELAGGVTKMSQAATQISSSNQQQLIGIEQVNEAMRQIQEASEHHIKRIKVIEEAVQSLHLAGQELQGLVEQTGV